jgi:hypothetical protein
LNTFFISGLVTGVESRRMREAAVAQPAE